MYKTKKGFTLVELLVVIAIIGVLSSIVISSLNNARAKGRDGKRLQDIQQLMTALEMYYLDNNAYPLCNGDRVCAGPPGYADPLSALPLTPTYISVIPTDPKNINGQYGYYYARGWKKTSPTTYLDTGSDQDYIVGTRLETRPPTYAGWNVPLSGTNGLNVLKGTQ